MEEDPQVKVLQGKWESFELFAGWASYSSEGIPESIVAVRLVRRVSIHIVEAWFTVVVLGGVSDLVACGGTRQRKVRDSRHGRSPLLVIEKPVKSTVEASGGGPDFETKALLELLSITSREDTLHFLFPILSVPDVSSLILLCTFVQAEF